MTQAARAAALIPISDVRHDAAWAQANPAAHRMLIAVAQDPYADEPGHAAGARRQLEARRHHDCWDRLPQIRCPVLVAAGRYDGIAPSEIQHRLASRIPNARLQFFEGGHWFIQQDPEAITVIRAFLAASA